MRTLRRRLVADGWSALVSFLRLPKPCTTRPAQALWLGAVLVAMPLLLARWRHAQTPHMELLSAAVAVAACELGWGT